MWVQIFYKSAKYVGLQTGKFIWYAQEIGQNEESTFKMVLKPD